MTPFEARLFEELPCAAEALPLRLCDERAEVPGRRTPPLAYDLGPLEGYDLRRNTGWRIEIASLSVA